MRVMLKKYHPHLLPAINKGFMMSDGDDDQKTVPI